MKASSSPLVVAAAVLVVVAASGACTVKATIDSTCQAAAVGDQRVDVQFCTSQLAAYSGSAEADTLGLAKIAALIGVDLGAAAVRGMSNGTVNPPAGSRARARVAMDACSRAYDAVGRSFAEAFDLLVAGRYAAANERMARVAPLAQRCDGVLARAGAMSPLPMYSANCTQMAIIGTAITNLIR